MNNMDYKKLAEEAHNLAIACNCSNLGVISGTIQSCADAIETLLEQVEQMKNLHMKVQVGHEELSISELCNRLERMKKAKDDAVHDRMMAEQKFNELYKRAEMAESRVQELEITRPVQVDGDVFELAVKLAKVTAERDKAVETLRSLASYHGACMGCKRAKKECSHVLLCKVDGKNHWEWGGLDD